MAAPSLRCAGGGVECWCAVVLVGSVAAALGNSSMAAPLPGCSLRRWCQMLALVAASWTHRRSSRGSLIGLEASPLAPIASVQCRCAHSLIRHFVAHSVTPHPRSPLRGSLGPSPSSVSQCECGSVSMPVLEWECSAVVGVTQRWCGVCERGCCAMSYRDSTRGSMGVAQLWSRWCGSALPGVTVVW